MSSFSYVKIIIIDDGSLNISKHSVEKKLEIKPRPENSPIIEKFLHSCNWALKRVISAQLTFNILLLATVSRELGLQSSIFQTKMHRPCIMKLSLQLLNKSYRATLWWIYKTWSHSLWVILSHADIDAPKLVNKSRQYRGAPLNVASIIHGNYLYLKFAHAGTGLTQ